MEVGNFGATRVAFGDVIDVLKKNMTGTLFGTVGVVELSYRKFGEFVVKWMGKLANENKV